MNSRQAAEFQRLFTELVNKTQTGTFFVVGLIDDDEDGSVRAMTLGNIEGDSPQGGMMMTSVMIDALFGVLARYNGLTPGAAAGALHALIDAALDEIIDSEDEKPPTAQA